MEDKLDPAQVRDLLVDRLNLDLVGPLDSEEEIDERPSDRYATGILYPVNAEIGDEEDDSFGRGDSEGEGGNETDEAIPLRATVKPSSAGLSFCIESDEGADAVVDLHISCGTYLRNIDADGRPARSWRRIPHETNLESVHISVGETTIPLGGEGLTGLEVYIRADQLRDQTLITTVALVNRNIQGETRSESEERTFFQTGLKIRCRRGSELCARPSPRVALDEDGRIASLIYRDAREFAVGHSCAADWETIDGRVEVIRTCWIPRADVAAVSPSGSKVFQKLRDRDGPSLSATWLSQEVPSADLETGLQDFIGCYTSWIQDQERDIKDLSSAGYRAQAQRNLATCSVAADRMKESASLLSRDALVRRAFQLAQAAMVQQRRWSEGDPNLDLEWRPFQLGFQLLALASLAQREHPDRSVMDLLWFPTGGGKTEAYLSLIAFLIFLRRLRAESDSGEGVAVLMRYTLRLLTVQQFQRAATLICACENIRRRDSSGDLGSTPVSVGLWVGNSATPSDADDARRVRDGSTKTHKQLTACPCCGGRLDWPIGADSTSVHCVGDQECALREIDPQLPVWTVDQDIYRETPSLLIATVDKFAQIVRRPDTAAFFAASASHHPPELIIQDELHLITGPLGSITGLYETAIDLICSSRGTRPKVIGSTATIRRAEDQILRLFNRRTFQFPPPAIDGDNSCFAVLDPASPSRAYLGISTAGRSEKYLLQAVSAALLQAAGAAATSDEKRDPYWTLVGYFNTLRALGGSLVLMQDDVPISIEQFANRHGESPREVQPPEELTSRVGSTRLREIMDELKLQLGEPGCLDIVLATNMISVGVDFPRLGLMLVVGQPKTISEYIQATSRVGRHEPGLIVTLYNNGRVRDRAHFETFKSWHQTLYREVEAATVTPFASRAQDKALHAVLVALVRHLVPGMRDSPTLDPPAREATEALVREVISRVSVADPTELQNVISKLETLLNQWVLEGSLERYWDDFGNRHSLLLSAEQYAAGVETGGAHSRALWPTPNSMREVEPGTPFILLEGLSVR